MSNGKDMIIHLIIVGLIKMKLNEILTSQYFPKPYESSGGDIKMSKLIHLIMQQKQN